MSNFVRASLLAFALVFASGCHGPVTETLVRPWFKTANTQPLVIFPHALGVGGASSAYTLVDGSWQTVIERERGAFSARAVSDVVVVEPYRGGTRRVYHRGSIKPALIRNEYCPHLVADPASSTFICLGCGTSPPLEGFLQDAYSARSAETNAPSCEDVTVTTLDYDARTLSRYTVDASAVEWVSPEIRGFTPQGEAMLHVRSLVRGYVDPIHYAIRASGLERISTPLCLTGHGLLRCECESRASCDEF
ncbi:MAG: hypothetical protein IPK60_13715 [Sandaracinaceae bacterium]|nr:hypothetical protein [Sandaracinaceae bacterium]